MNCSVSSSRVKDFINLKQADGSMREPSINPAAKQSIRSATVLLVAFSFCWITVVETASAQVSRRGSTQTKSRVLKTEVQFQLLTEGRGTTALAAQQWGQIFQKLGVNLRIRKAILDDKVEVTEEKLGRMRMVKVIGKLDAKGRIIFPDRFFTKDQTAKLVEWIRELQTYGAKGSPVGKPAFGLDQTKFGAVYNALSQPLETEVFGKSFEKALASMKLPGSYPIRLTTAATALLKRRDKLPKARQSLKGFSKGTALAAFLNEYELGFRPLRTPDGSIELAIDSLKATDDYWPVGWPLSKGTSRLKTAPKLFKMVPVNIQELPLKDVLDAASIAGEIPILVDYYRIEEKGIDITTLKVSHPPKKTSWSLLLRGVTNPYKLTRRLLVDERGVPFVWITTLEAGLRSR